MTGAQRSERRAMRLAGKIAVVVGAGQSPGEGIGNGRATVLRFAQEGAHILAVDRDLASAEETAALAAKEMLRTSLMIFGKWRRGSQLNPAPWVSTAPLKNRCTPSVSH